MVVVAADGCLVLVRLVWGLSLVPWGQHHHHCHCHHRQGKYWLLIYLGYVPLLTSRHPWTGYGRAFCAGRCPTFSDFPGAMGLASRGFAFAALLLFRSALTDCC